MIQDDAMSASGAEVESPLEQKEEEQNENENPVEAVEVEDKLKQRREARRRKILENAKLRLDRLNGRINSSDFEQMKSHAPAASVQCEHDTQQYSDPEVEPDPLEYSQFRATNMDALGSSMDFENLLASMASRGISQETSEATGKEKSKYFFLIQYRLHVVLSTLLSYIFVFVGALNANAFSIFVPAGACVILELLVFRGQKQISPLVSLVVALCGLRTTRINTIYQVVSIIQDLITDLCLSVFLIFSLTSILKLYDAKYDNLLILK